MMPRSETIATAEAVIASKAMAALRIGAPIGTVRSRSSTIFNARPHSQGFQDALRGVRLLEHLDAERRERIVDGIADSGGGADRAGFADAFHAERGAGDRRLDVRYLDVGHLPRHRHEVVGHRAVEELARLVVEAFLVERSAHSLHHTAADLLVGEERVDHLAAVLDHPMLEEPDEAGLRVDLDQARLDAIGE